MGALGWLVNEVHSPFAWSEVTHDRLNQIFSNQQWDDKFKSVRVFCLTTTTYFCILHLTIYVFCNV